MSHKQETFRNLGWVCLLGLAVLMLSSTGFADDKGAGSVSPVGSWFGNAKSPDPNSPLGEVFMMPTFFADGTLIANDSHEVNNPHTTAHGSWVRLGQRKVKATFIWINLAPPGTAPNGVAGTFRITLLGEISPKNQDEMTGTLHPVFFPAGVNPVTAKDEDGASLGTFEIEQLQRIR